MGFVNCFPDELRIGDVWGEYGELRSIRKNVHSMTYEMYFKPEGVHGPGRYEKEWPHNAPIRVLRSVDE